LSKNCFIEIVYIYLRIKIFIYHLSLLIIVYLKIKYFTFHTSIRKKIRLFESILNSYKVPLALVPHTKYFFRMKVHNIYIYYLISALHNDIIYSKNSVNKLLLLCTPLESGIRNIRVLGLQHLLALTTLFWMWNFKWIFPVEISDKCLVFGISIFLYAALSQTRCYFVLKLDWIKCYTIYFSFFGNFDLYGNVLVI